MAYSAGDSTNTKRTAGFPVNSGVINQYGGVGGGTKLNSFSTSGKANIWKKKNPAQMGNVDQYGGDRANENPFGINQ